MPKDSHDSSGPLKVTDKRIFTPDGTIRDEFRDIEPSDQMIAPPAPAPPSEGRTTEAAQRPAEGRKTLRDTATNPGSVFSNFIESLIANTYMSLGLLRSPYPPQPPVDLEAARQMIDILSMLHEKTAGNLTKDESEFFQTHLAELKFKYVQKSKAI